MSTGSSSSRALRLRLDESRLRRRCLWLLAAACLTLLGCLLARGHLALVLVIAMPLALQYRDLAADRARGTVLVYSGGRWSLLERGENRPLELLRFSRGLGSLVYLEFRRATGYARPIGLFVFRDALPPADYRRLRVRLALTPEPRVPGEQGGILRHQYRIPRLR